MMSGCSGPDTSEDLILLKVGSQIITVDDFNRSYNLTLAGMREAESEDDQGERESKVRLLKELGEEAALIERAKELGIRVSPSELSAAVDGIKKDYPDETFEEMLIENAILYADWEKEMEKRLVIDKLLDQEVLGKVQITEQELAGIYQQQSSVANSESSVKNPDQEARLVELLRREKAEALLEQLMASIRSTYKIEINEEAVEDLIGQ
jgi:hypothetical protein